MKILILNGSPKREKSDTLKVTAAFIEGMMDVWPQEISIINAVDKHVEYCTGCFSCMHNGGNCVHNDDMRGILDEILESDLLIWSFPLYCYAMPSHLKAVLDRTIPLVKMKMVEKADGKVQHETLADFSKKHTLVICGCGFPDWDGNFNGLRIMCEHAFCNPTMVCVPETPLLNVPQAAIVADPLLAKFEKAGEEYAKTFALSAETIAALEYPMISKEDYLRNVNGG